MTFPVGWTVSEVGPGKTYSTLQAWWDAVYTDSDPRQLALCFGGADLGVFSTVGKVNPFADDDNYPAIMPAPGQAHNLTASTSYAHSTSATTDTLMYITQPEIRVKNMLFYLPVGGNAVVTQAAGPVYIDGCLVIGAGDGDIAFYSTNSAGEVYVMNCLTYGCGGCGFFADTPTITHWSNCGAVNCGNNIGAAIFECGFGSQRANHEFVNCYVLNDEAIDAVGFKNGGIGGTPQISFTATFDSTADDWGGSSNLLSVSNSGQVVDFDANWTALVGSDLEGAGDDLSAGFNIDAVGYMRSAPWWIGPSQPPELFRLPHDFETLVNAGAGVPPHIPSW